MVQVERIVGSIWQIYDINEALAAGADIVRIPSKFFPQPARRPKSTKAVDQVLADFRKLSERLEDS